MSPEKTVFQALHSRTSDRFGSPLALGKQDSTVVGCKTNDVDRFFAVPPSPNSGVRVEFTASNSLPDGLLADVLERGCNVGGKIGFEDAVCTRLVPPDQLGVGGPDSLGFTARRAD